MSAEKKMSDEELHDLKKKKKLISFNELNLNLESNLYFKKI
jgi:hypothetical protein